MSTLKQPLSYYQEIFTIQGGVCSSYYNTEIRRTLRFCRELCFLGLPFQNIVLAHPAYREGNVVSSFWRKTNKSVSKSRGFWMCVSRMHRDTYRRIRREASKWTLRKTRRRSWKVERPLISWIRVTLLMQKNRHIFLHFLCISSRGKHVALIQINDCRETTHS